MDDLSGPLLLLLTAIFVGIDFLHVDRFPPRPWAQAFLVGAICAIGVTHVAIPADPALTKGAWVFSGLAAALAVIALVGRTALRVRA